MMDAGLPEGLARNSGLQPKALVQRRVLPLQKDDRTKLCAPDQIHLLTEFPSERLAM